VVCILTGNGLKDPDIAMARAAPFVEVPAEIGSVEEALGWS